MCHKLKAKHKHGDAVTILLGDEDSDVDFDEIKGYAHNPQFNKSINDYEYQLMDEDGKYVQDGEFFPQDALVRDTSRPPRI